MSDYPKNLNMKVDILRWVIFVPTVARVNGALPIRFESYARNRLALSYRLYVNPDSLQVLVF